MGPPQDPVGGFSRWLAGERRRLAAEYRDAVRWANKVAADLAAGRTHPDAAECAEDLVLRAAARLRDHAGLERAWCGWLARRFHKQWRAAVRMAADGGEG